MLHIFEVAKKRAPIVCSFIFRVQYLIGRDLYIIHVQIRWKICLPKQMNGASAWGRPRSRYSHETLSFEEIFPGCFFQEDTGMKSFPSF